MEKTLQVLCGEFGEARQTLRRCYRMENDMIRAVGANIFCARGIPAQEERIRECKRLLKGEVGIFSNFRGNSEVPVTCLMAASGDPDQRLTDTLSCYAALKEHFFGSTYLALVAALLSDLTTPDRAGEAAARGKAIYRRMRAEHPFLTGSEDSVFAVLMAFSEKDDDALIADMEQCYTLLKQTFHNSEAVQTLSHVLAMAPGTPEERCDRLVSLYQALRDMGIRYGRGHELSALGALSLCDGDVQALCAQLREADSLLSSQRGYGFFGMGRRIRLMHAAMLVSDLRSPGGAAEPAALSATLCIVAAQQAAMCAAVAASSASASSSASH